MTQAERSTLGLVIAQLDRMEGKVDRMDDRLRAVELATAGNIAADARTQQQGTNEVGKWTVRLGALGIVCSLAIAASNFVAIHLS